MNTNTVDKSQLIAGRTAGLMFLLTMATAQINEYFVRAGIYVSGDAEATANNIMASEQLFRIGIVLHLLTTVGAVVLIFALKILLQPVNKNLAALAMLWRLLESAFFGALTITSFIVLLLLTGGEYLTVFEEQQTKALMMLFVRAHGYGYFIGLVFYGFGSTLFTYLLFKSRYIPRILSAIGVVASLGVLIGTIGVIIFPAHASSIISVYFIPPFLFEVATGFWLLVFGANLAQQKAKSR